MSQMIQVTSSNISEIGYNEFKEILVIKFTSGKLYVYNDVPPKVHADFMSAGSKGTYFGSNIKNKYTTQSIIKSELVNYLGNPSIPRRKVDYAEAVIAASALSKSFRGASAFF